MKSRIRIPKKSTREQTPDFSAASAQSMFQSRPFVVQSKSEETSQQPDLKTKLMQAQRYGHLGAERSSTIGYLFSLP